MKNSIVNICITAFLLIPFIVWSQSNKAVKSISIPDYGPVAFDSFWRLPNDSINEHNILNLSSRISTDHQNSRYFTQYFQTDILLGCGHSLSIRMPYHYFQVDQYIADRLEMENKSGLEFGDIDIIFNIRILKKFLARSKNNRAFCYLTGEMHTAPTGRNNRQFNDVIKLLGTVNTGYSIIKNERHSLTNVLSIGGGGWDDLVNPAQKHALKLSDKLNYKITLKNKKGIGVFLGGTYIYAEGNCNEGLYCKTGLYYWKHKGFQIGLNLGLLNYTKISGRNVSQYELSAILPIRKKSL